MVLGQASPGPFAVPCGPSAYSQRMTVRVPPRGKRGVPFPRLPSWLTRAYSRRQLRAFREQHGGRTQGGVHALELETIGAKSGETRHAMVGYLDAGPGAWLIAATLAGAARNPAWLHNLARNPRATIEFGDGRRVAVTAETVDGPELEAAWQKIGREAPEFTKYQSKTDRTISLLRLRAVDEGSQAPG